MLEYYGQNQCIGHRDIYVAFCYRPNVAKKTFTSHLRKSVDDFNLPGRSWFDLTLKPRTTYVPQHAKFCDLLDDFGLTQCVLEPTTRSNTLSPNLPDRVNSVKVIPGISDHEIFMELAVHLNYATEEKGLDAQ